MGVAKSRIVSNFCNIFVAIKYLLKNIERCKCNGRLWFENECRKEFCFAGRLDLAGANYRMNLMSSCLYSYLLSYLLVVWLVGSVSYEYIELGTWYKSLMCIWICHCHSVNETQG